MFAFTKPKLRVEKNMSEQDMYAKKPLFAAAYKISIDKEGPDG